jgi:hypothetical protein
MPGHQAPNRPGGGGRPVHQSGQNFSSGGINGDGLLVALYAIPGLTKKASVPTRGLLLQCPPLEEFSVEYAYSYSDYDTIRKGQFSRAGGQQLRTVTFDTIVVDPETQVRLLRDLLESGSPVQFTAFHVAGSASIGKAQGLSEMAPGVELMMPATLRSLRSTERAGEVDARYVTLGFTEYRDPALQSKARAGSRSFPQNVRLEGSGKATVGGQKVGGGAVTLSKLARQFYGDPSLWKLIRNANHLSNVSANDPLVKHGKYKKLKDNQVLPVKIPKPPKGTKLPDPWRGTGG